MFPARCYYQGEQHASIGLNPLTCDKPLWYTLADCLAAKFLTGKIPKSSRRSASRRGRCKKGLQPIDLLDG